jgi:hypothetical protein
MLFCHIAIDRFLTSNIEMPTGKIIRSAVPWLTYIFYNRQFARGAYSVDATLVERQQASRLVLR